MLDAGNFVLASPAGVNLWQSFDQPTDTMLSTQNLNNGGFGYQVIFKQSVYMYLISRNGTILNSVFSDSASMQDFYQRATLDYGGVFRHYLYPKNASGSRNWAMDCNNLSVIPSNNCLEC
ncbi:hypothetical protein NC653_000298 [Populus alba x Populus x berolinensis]|uniref:Bulb-type lectin domain-containing protein n=1 Tax=Populus alba x Populus x berolinensis TaxID=444605 RepID=A0AAD6WE72_9ROSI|nr:hypothetical protein NC653_000298 [Populus alba x Populus x berolinensis]